jgi:small subunit ribosomal protein S27e
MNMAQLIPKPSSKFLKVTCSKCKNEQIIYNKAATNVKCLVCNAELAEARGGKAKIKAKVLQVMD